MEKRLRRLEKNLRRNILRVRRISYRVKKGSHRKISDYSGEFLEIFRHRTAITFFAIDKNRDYLISEGKGLAALGRTSGQAVGKSIYKVYSKDSWFVQAVERTFQTGKYVSASGKRGETHWFDAELAPICDIKGNVTEVIGIGVDVTAKKKYETICGQQLAALTASIDGLAVYGNDERIIFINEAHARIYGYENSEELIGKSWKIFYSGKELERFNTVIMPHFSREKKWRGEAIGTRKDGSTFFQEISLSHVGDAEGLVCVARDITQKKKYELGQELIAKISKALALSNDYETTIEATASIPTEKFADYSIVCVNPVQRLGEKKHVGTCTPLDPSLVDRLKSHTFHSNPDASELVNHPCEAILHPLLQGLQINSYIFVPLKIKNSVIGNIAFLRTASHPQGGFDDLDHQTACELGTRAALGIENARLFLEAQEAIRAREHMMATVSHDLQNPLAATSVGIELLSRITGSSDPSPQAAAITAKINFSLSRMNTLIKQLLDFEKMRSGTFLIEKSPTHIQGLINGTVSEFDPICKKKGIQFTIALEPELKNSHLLCDSDKILRVLSNLIGNSVKFTPKNGRIALDVTQDKSNLIFKVSDTGTGIPKEELANVFKIYWQAKSTCSQGNGLGLAIARRIVEAHNGKIWVESGSKSGSVFCFSIPK